MRLLPLVAVFLCSCAAAPKPGELANAERNRKELRALIDRQAIASAKEVRLSTEALAAWEVTHVALTPQLFEKKLSTDKNRSYDNPYVYVHERDVDWRCRDSASVPVFVRRKAEGGRFDAVNFLTFGAGDCYRLAAPQGGFVADLSLFNLSIDLTDELTRQKLASNADDTLRGTELDFHKGLHNKTLDTQTWQVRDVSVAERAGYYERPTYLLHANLYSVPAERSYRLLLVGKQTIVFLKMTGPLSASLDELQAQAAPILSALAYRRR
jgi:hypothetical protein